MKKIITHLILIFICWPLLSQEQTKPGHFESRENDGIYFVFDDSKEALIYTSHTDPYDISVNLDLNESSCSNSYTQPKCFLKTQISFDYIVAIWSKHPDSTKIGKIVKYSYSDENNDSVTEIKFFNYNSYNKRFITHKEDTRFKADIFICSNIDWFNNLELKKQNDKTYLAVDVWSSESMLVNPETGLNENRTETMIENVVFNLEENHINDNKFFYLNFISLNKFITSNTFSSGPLLASGNILNLIFKSQIKNTNICHASFSLSLESSISGIDIDSHYKEKPNFKKFMSYKSLEFKLFDRFYGSILTSTSGKFF